MPVIYNTNPSYKKYPVQQNFKSPHCLRVEYYIINSLKHPVN